MDPVTLAAGIGGAAGKLGEGLLSIGGGLLSAHAQYKYQKRLMQRQFELANATRRRYYSDTRYSLEKAGFNPVLAFGGASGGSGNFVASASGAPAPDLSFGDGATEAAQSAIALKQKQDELDLLKKKTEQDLELDRKQAEAQIDKTKAETSNVEANTEKTKNFTPTQFFDNLGLGFGGFLRLVNSASTSPIAATIKRGTESVMDYSAPNLERAVHSWRYNAPGAARNSEGAGSRPLLIIRKKGSKK